MDKFSYSIGLGIGQNLSSMGIGNLAVDDFAQAIKDVLEGNQTAISHNEAREIVNKYFEELEAKMGAVAIEQGQAFLEENKKGPGVVVLPSGLQYEIIKEGTGKKPKATDQVRCHYEGTLIDGTLFDSSIQRGEPAVFGVNQVIPGWVEALQLMPEGSKWKLYIPSELAYGARGAGEMIQAPKANLKSDIDSLSYSIGMAQTQGLKGYLTGRLDVDTAYMADFIKGLNEGANKTSKKDIAYMAGLQIGQQISNQMMKGINQELFGTDSTKTISKENFMAGFIAGTLEKGGVMTMEAAQEYTRTAMETIKAKALEEKYADYKAENEKFLAENKTKDGVKTTASGLQYKVITEGKGEIPADTCKVKVNYKGTLIDGTEFDSSYKRNEPSTFRANQVIKGWTEALTMMPVGSKWELYIPQELAYGARESGNQIKPFSTLIFEVELLGIEKDKK